MESLCGNDKINKKGLHDDGFKVKQGPKRFRRVSNKEVVYSSNDCGCIFHMKAIL